MTDFMRSAFAKKGQEHELVGQCVEVGEYSFTIKKVIAQGGFGFIFLVVDGAGRSYALKRIIASGEREKVVKKEVAMMKLVSGHPNIVEFVTAAVLSGKNTKHGNTEFLIIQELCAAPLKDVLDPLIASKQLRHDQRLHCFHKVCEAVAHLHMLKPPVIHRDLKIDNVLLSASGEIKLCDFGSATHTVYTPTLDWSFNQRETAEDEINCNTTPIFRSPEMLDLYMNMPIGPKADIWALGCLLYQLCFGVSPFEESGRLGSLNGKYKVPAQSEFEDFLPLIAGMLTVDTSARWDIQKVLEEVGQLARRLHVDLYSPLPYPLAIPPSVNLVDGSATAAAVGELLSSAGASISHGSSKLFGFVKGGAGSLMKGIKDTSTKVVSTMQGLSKSQLDLSYITSRILVLGAPFSDVPDAISRNPINDVCEFFDSMPGHQYVVFNLNNRTFDDVRCHGQVVSCGWQPRSTPQLRQLLSFCRSLHKYLMQTPQGVAVIHCDDGRTQSALAVAAYLLYSDVFKLPSTSLVMYGKKRYPDGHRGLVLPSHKRYLDYMVQMIKEQEQAQLHCRRFRLKQIILNGVPKFNLHRSGCKPVVEVLSGDGSSWLSADPQQLERCRSYTDADGAIVMPLEQMVVGGDLRIGLHHVRHLSTLTTSTVRMFSFNVHTSFLSPTADCLLYKLSDIDSITSNTSKFPPNFTVTLHLESTHEGDSDPSLAIWKKISMKQKSPHVCFESVAEEQEILGKFGPLDVRGGPSPALRSANGRSSAQVPAAAGSAAGAEREVEPVADPAMEQGDAEVVMNLLADFGDGDSEEEEASYVGAQPVLANRTTTSDLLGGMDDDVANVPAPQQRQQQQQQQAAAPSLFDLGGGAISSSDPVVRTSSSPTGDLLGGSHVVDPFSDLAGFSSAPGAQQSQPVAPTLNLLGGPASFPTAAATAPATATADADLLGGMVQEDQFDPFSSTPASGVSSPLASAGTSQTHGIGRGASPTADLMMGGGGGGADLLLGGGGMQSTNLLGGGGGGGTGSSNTQSTPFDLMGNGGGSSGVNLMGGFGGGMGSAAFPGASRTLSSPPMNSGLSGTTSPMGGMPGGVGGAANPMGGFGGMGAYGGGQHAAPMGYQTGAAPAAAKPADPFAQLGAFGASAAPASRGAPSSGGGSQPSAGLSARSAGMAQGPGSLPHSAVPSPGSSGRSTPSMVPGTGLSKPTVYTSVIGGRDERGTRMGVGAGGIPKRVEVGAFDDLLSRQGFQADKNDRNVSLKDMRDKDLEKTMDPIKLQIMKWTEGKRKNIRALIAALPEVLWESAVWTPVEMHKLVQPNDIKKAYRKACLCVHPDKLTGEPEEELAKAIFVELNEAWTAFEQNKDMTRVG